VNRKDGRGNQLQESTLTRSASKGFRGEPVGSPSLARRVGAGGVPFRPKAWRASWFSLMNNNDFAEFFISLFSPHLLIPISQRRK
jgi:hypothetical protein